MNFMNFGEFPFEKGNQNVLHRVSTADIKADENWIFFFFFLAKPRHVPAVIVFTSSNLIINI